MGWGQLRRGESRAAGQQLAGPDTRRTAGQLLRQLDTPPSGSGTIIKSQVSSQSFTAGRGCKSIDNVFIAERELIIQCRTCSRSLRCEGLLDSGWTRAASAPARTGQSGQDWAERAFGAGTRETEPNGPHREGPRCDSGPSAPSKRLEVGSPAVGGGGGGRRGTAQAQMQRKPVGGGQPGRARQADMALPWPPDPSLGAGSEPDTAQGSAVPGAGRPHPQASWGSQRPQPLGPQAAPLPLTHTLPPRLFLAFPVIPSRPGPAWPGPHGAATLASMLWWGQQPAQPSGGLVCPRVCPCAGWHSGRALEMVRSGR